MSNKTKKPFSELLQSTLSPEERAIHKENYSNEELSTFELIPYTPFFVVGDPNKGYAAVMGKFKITETMDSKEQVVELVHAQPYELLITIMSCVFETILELKNKPLDQATKQPELLDIYGRTKLNIEEKE